MMYETNNERVDVKLIKFAWVTRLIKSIFKSKILPYIVMLIALSMVSVMNVYPFGISMLVIATLYSIPIIIPIAVTCVVFVILKIPVSIFVSYVVISIIYGFISTIFLKNKSNQKLYLIMLITICQIVFYLIQMLFVGYSMDNIVSGILCIALSVGAIPVFLNGVVIPFNFGKKMIYSTSEIISFALILSMVLTLISGVNIYGFNIATVGMLVIIVIVGWQNDWTTGAIAGAVIALTFSMISKASPLVLITFTFSGIISGVMNKFGKWSLVLLFAIGNVLLAYMYRSEIEFATHISQILVASCVIIALPSKFILKLEELFSNSILLDKGYENQLGPAIEIKNKMGAIAEVFNKLSSITVETNEETRLETMQVLEKYLKEYIKNECVTCKTHNECEQEVAKAASYLAERLENGEYITSKMLPFECSKNEIVINEILEIYSNMKLMRLVREREINNSQKLATQYKNISNVLSSIDVQQSCVSKIRDNTHKHIREELTYNGYAVYEDHFNKVGNIITYEYITDILVDIDKAKAEIQKIVSVGAKMPMVIKLILNSSKTEKSRIKLVTKSKYIVEYDIKQYTKSGSEITGDAYAIFENESNDKIFVLSDGMGSGAKSKEASKKIISVIEKMSKCEMKEEQILSVIKSVLDSMTEDSYKSTMDMLVINENKEMISFTKLDAAFSFIIQSGEVTAVNVNGLNKEIENIKLKQDMYIVMMTDGAVPYIPKMLIQDIVKDNPITSSKDLLNEIEKNVLGIMLDDATIAVIHIK